MARRWLVAVDSGTADWYAFNYTLHQLDRRIDHLYILHVKEIQSSIPAWYTPPQSGDAVFVKEAQIAEHEKAKKLLTYYVNQARNFGVSLVHRYLFRFFGVTLLIAERCRFATHRLLVSAKSPASSLSKLLRTTKLPSV